MLCPLGSDPALVNLPSRALPLNRQSSLISGRDSPTIQLGDTWADFSLDLNTKNT
jgi:hypothetical protein